MIAPLSLLRTHGDSRIKLYNMNGRCVFPVIGASGGVTTNAMVYFYNGELQSGVDLGRKGCMEIRFGRSTGFSCAVEISPWDISAKAKIREALKQFSQFLDEKGVKP